MFYRVYDKKRKALIDFLLTQSTRSGMTMVVVISLIAAVVWSSFPTHVVVIWMCTGYILNLSRKYFFIVIKKRVSPNSVYIWLENALVILLFLSGLFWGAQAGCF